MKYLGIIYKERGSYSAGVKVVRCIDDEDKISEDDSLKNLKKKFPPNGFVHLGNKGNYNRGDTITFSQNLKKLNDDILDEKDHFQIDSKVELFPAMKIYKTLNCPFFCKEKFYIKENINKIIDEKINYNSTDFKIKDNFFYLYNQGCVLGKFKIQDNKIIPVKGKEIKYWKADNQKLPILGYDVRYDLMLEEPDCEHDIADCMNSTQLAKWFKEELGKINNDLTDELLNKLLNKRGWQKKLENNVESYKNTDDRVLFKVRVERIFNNLDFVKLKVEDISFFAEKSSTFQKIYDDSIKEFKEELLKDSSLQKEKDSLHKEIENKKNELSDLKNKIAKQEGLNLEKKALNDHLESDKERLLKDFKIFSGINPAQPKLPAECKQVKNYRLEVVESDDSILDDRESIIKRMEYYLSSNGLNSKYAEYYLKHIESYKFIFIPDVKIAKAFVEAAGKSKYILQQVGCDWLNFRTLWDNGFSEIWESSCNNPDLLHILILQDINLSSPECWGKPLFDLIRGVRDKVPYSNTEWPANLRITATVLPFDNPPIALPLYQGTFMECGVIEKRKDLLSENDTKEPAEHAEGYFISPLLEKHFKIDELEQSNSRDELNKLDDYFKG